jgi:hypothetical protein
MVHGLRDDRGVLVVKQLGGVLAWASVAREFEEHQDGSEMKGKR